MITIPECANAYLTNHNNIIYKSGIIVGMDDHCHIANDIIQYCSGPLDALPKIS